MLSLPDPVPCPVDHLAERRRAAAPALVLRDEVLDWENLRIRVARLAAWLARHVPEKGARVASWAGKGELTCLLPLATARAGLVHVPINPLLKRTQVAHIVADSGASMLIANSARLSTLEQGDIGRYCRLESGDAADPVSLALRDDAADGLPPSDADPAALAALLYTSGSTGRPKGVMLSHANLWLGAASVAHYLGLAEDDVTLAVLPLSFDYGQNQLLSAWYAGGAAVPLDYLAPRDVIKACSRHGVTTLAAVPPLWLQLVEQDWPGDAVAPLRRLTNSGGALTVDLVRRLRALAPRAQLVPMYGLTEAFRSTWLDPELVDTHPTSIGRAIPFAEVLVIGEGGDVTAPGEEGELVHCGPLVAQGYWNDPQRTAERFRPAPAASMYGGTAVWSGDRVIRDREGLLTFVGRRDAMIKTSGNRVSPQEIEEAVLATGLASEAVAIGVPDAQLGQAVHLIVRGSGDAPALRAALKRELPTFMQPHVIRWIERMPLNPNGKIDRTALEAEAAA